MKNTKRYFRVKYGFERMDQVSIEESEVEKAVYAQITGTPIQIGHSYIKGSNIISITPHWHKHTGWNEWYEPTDGEDWKQIERDCPKYDGVLEHYKNRVQLLMQTGRTKEIGKNVSIPELDSGEKKYTGSSNPEMKELSDQLTNKFKV